MKWSVQWAPCVLSALRIVTGLLFLEHGTMKLLGFPHVTPPPPRFPLLSFPGLSGPMELIGGIFIVLGLFTRPVAFLLSGEMAIGYFMVHAPHGFFPLRNGGEPAILYCFVFLYLAFAGGGSLSADRLLGRKHG